MNEVPLHLNSLFLRNDHNKFFPFYTHNSQIYDEVPNSVNKHFECSMRAHLEEYNDTEQNGYEFSSQVPFNMNSLRQGPTGPSSQSRGPL